MLKKSLLPITLIFGLSTNLFLSSLVATAKPQGYNTRNPNSQPVKPAVTKTYPRFRFKVANPREWRNREGGDPVATCVPQDPSAVVPQIKNDSPRWKLPVELTLSDRPTIFVNAYATPTKKARFILREEGNNNILLDETLSLTIEKGIVAYTLPANFSGLEIGKTYKWRFSAICDFEDRSGDSKVFGLIKRVKPSAKIAQQLAGTKTDRERALIYAENGYWHDTVKALLDLRVANPQDRSLIQDWWDLFRSVGLQSLEKQPVVQIQGDETPND
ncbi:MAG TPA: DUF928 domain-containing protein [Nostocaceae cyanobacterium]|nr:DUF928 domain-containing protein [Nostocaceae cyanobacterium]